MSTVVGGHARQLSYWSLRNVFLGSIRGGDRLQSSTQQWARETGETAHVERWNKTLRQRLARFVRMTLSFSKSVMMHEACLLLFLHRYNEDRAILLK